MWRLLILIIILSIQNVSAETRWESVAPDLELGRVEVDKESFFSSEILFIRTSLTEYRLTVLRAVSFGQTTSSAKALALKSNAVMTINANFFDENGKPLGLVVSQGIQQQKIHQGGNTLTGVFFVTRENIGIVNRSNFQSDLVIEAVQAGPRLLASGNKIKGLNKNEIRTRRSGVCVDKKKRLIFFITTGFMGITLHQLQEMILTPDIGCVDALNLDGGGSAQMYLDTQHASGQSKIDNITIHGSEPVPVMLALRQR